MVSLTIFSIVAAISGLILWYSGQRSPGSFEFGFGRRKDGVSYRNLEYEFMMEVLLMSWSLSRL